MIRTLRIGTRGSPLALVQARLVATALRDAHDWGPEHIEIVPIAGPRSAIFIELCRLGSTA